MLRERHAATRAEIEHLARLIEADNLGVQIGLVTDTLPQNGFQIFRQAERSTLTISPFRLGAQPNIRVGVAMLTSAPEALKLHDQIVKDAWKTALKGPAAVDYLRGLLDADRAAQDGRREGRGAQDRVGASGARSALRRRRHRRRRGAAGPPRCRIERAARFATLSDQPVRKRATLSNQARSASAPRYRISDRQTPPRCRVRPSANSPRCRIWPSGLRLQAQLGRHHRQPVIPAPHDGVGPQRAGQVLFLFAQRLDPAQRGGAYLVGRIGAAVHRAEDAFVQIASRHRGAVPPHQHRPPRSQRARQRVAFGLRDHQQPRIAEFVAAVPIGHLRAHGRAGLATGKQRRAGLREWHDGGRMVMADGADVGTGAVDRAVDDAFENRPAGVGSTGSAFMSYSMMSSGVTRLGAPDTGSRKRSGRSGCRTLTWPKASTGPLVHEQAVRQGQVAFQEVRSVAMFA